MRFLKQLTMVANAVVMVNNSHKLGMKMVVISENGWLLGMTMVIVIANGLLRDDNGYHRGQWLL